MESFFRADAPECHDVVSLLPLWRELVQANPIWYYFINVRARRTLSALRTRNANQVSIGSAQLKRALRIPARRKVKSDYDGYTCARHVREEIDPMKVDYVDLVVIQRPADFSLGL